MRFTDSCKSTQNLRNGTSAIRKIGSNHTKKMNKKIKT